GFFAPGDPAALSHADWLEQQFVDPILTRTAPRGAYDVEPLLARAQLFRQLGDAAALATIQTQVQFLIHNLTTAGTLHVSEGYGLVNVDLNGDGIAPDYWPENDVPHVWEHAYLYAAAMVAFGSRNPGDPERTHRGPGPRVMPAESGPRGVEPPTCRVRCRQEARARNAPGKAGQRG